MIKHVADRFETRLEANGKSWSFQNQEKRKNQVYNIYTVKGKYSFYSLLETLYFIYRFYKHIKGKKKARQKLFDH